MQKIRHFNQDKGGEFRFILIYKKAKPALFMLGFAKNEKDNIRATDLLDLMKQSKHILSFSDEQVKDLIDKKIFKKVEGNK